MTDNKNISEGGLPLYNGNRLYCVMDKDMTDYLITHPSIRQKHMDSMLRALREETVFEKSWRIMYLLIETTKINQQKNLLKSLLDECKQDIKNITKIRATLQSYNFSAGDIDETERIALKHVEYLEKKINAISIESATCSK